MVMGSSLGELTLNFIFGFFFWLWLEYGKVEENPSSMAAEGWLENSHNELVNDIKHHLMPNFRPRIFTYFLGTL